MENLKGYIHVKMRWNHRLIKNTCVCVSVREMYRWWLIVHPPSHVHSSRMFICESFNGIPIFHFFLMCHDNISWQTSNNLVAHQCAVAHRLRITALKKCHDIPLRRNCAEVKEQRREYGQWMIETGLQRHRIYIDESGFNLWTRRNYGRARIGERVNRIVGGQKRPKCYGNSSYIWLSRGCVS